MADAESLPIDIHSGKLLDWLLSRRHCDADFQTQVQAIRQKINQAIQDMPEHPEIVRLLSGTYINYFHCLKILDILKQTEAETKNIFGQYSSQRIKDWREVVRLYEKDNVYLAEAAQILQRLVAYEVPGLKKQKTKCLTTAEECVKKSADYQKLSKDSERAFAKECEKWGVKGAHLKAELLALAQNLPNYLNACAEEAQDIMDVADYYVAFRTFLLGNPDMAAQSVPLLRYVTSKGNTTYYEYRTGEKPLQVELPQLKLDEEPTSDEIDFDVDLNLSNPMVADIEPTLDLEQSEIDFSDVQPLSDIVIEEGGVMGSGNEDISKGIARGDDALSILEHPETRRLFLSDLSELEAFLKSRILDSTSDSAQDVYVGQIVTLSSKLERSEDWLEKRKEKVSNLKAKLTDSKQKHLFKIRSSPDYVEKVAAELEQKKFQIEKNFRLSELMVERQKECKQEAIDLQPKVELLVSKTRELQRQIESDISKKYKNRPVNIMGEINTVLA